MKIAHLTGGIGEHTAGVGKAVSEMARDQIYAGHQVRIYAPITRAETTLNVTWNDVPTFAFKSCQPFIRLGRTVGLLSALADFDPDLMHVHGLWMWHNVDAYRWHVRSGCPYIFSPHGMMSPVALKYSRLKKIALRYWFQDRTIGNAAACHVTARSEADDVRLYGYQGRIEIIPPAIQPSSIPGDISREVSPIILSLGRLHPVKGLDRLIEAWADLYAEFPEWSLVIAGPDQGNYSDHLKRVISLRRLERVSIHPPVYGRDRDRLLASAQIFALPSLSENFAMTVPESLLMEVPVIATVGTPWSGLVEAGCGWWIDQGVTHLRVALSAAMKLPPDQRKRMGQQGRRWVLSSFAPQRITANTLASYLAATRETRRTPRTPSKPRAQR